jgi:hypothetical protein
MGPAEMRDLALPPGTEDVVAIYVNGVEKRAGEDYEVLADRIRLREPLTQREEVRGVGKILLSIGIGVYPKGDVIDLQIRRGGRTDVVRARPFEP